MTNPIANQVVEITTFRLNDGVEDTAFLALSPAITEFAQAQPGFIRRFLTQSEDGVWMDYVHWATLEDAQAAQAAFPQQPQLGPLMAMIDPTSLTMDHQALMDMAAA
ncbi:MAG: hypothetical protein AAFV19_08175 [Pseudomonadota bacterium]